MGEQEEFETTEDLEEEDETKGKDTDKDKEEDFADDLDSVELEEEQEETEEDEETDKDKDKDKDDPDKIAKELQKDIEKNQKVLNNLNTAINEAKTKLHKTRQEKQSLKGEDGEPALTDQQLRALFKEPYN